MDVKGKTVLVTGASSGLGYEFAKQFHALNCKVIITARRKDNLIKLADELNSIREGSAEILIADLSQDEGLNDAVSYIQKNHIDILVNNAGFGSFGHFEELSMEREVEMIRLNILASVTLLHAVLPKMKERRFGGVISVSSITGVQPIPYMATYSATKAFNLFHSLSVGEEVRGFGIKILTCCPGPTATEFGKSAKVPGDMAGKFRDTAENVVAKTIDALVKDRRMVFPGIVAKLLSFPSKVLPISVRTWAAGRIIGYKVF